LRSSKIVSFFNSFCIFQRLFFFRNSKIPII
jgi:hypothetical protein